MSAAGRPVPPPRDRRLPTAEPAAPERAAQLVRYIAADPALTDWLRGHMAAHLELVAASVEQLDTDDPAVVAEAIRKRADNHRRGDTPLW